MDILHDLHSRNSTGKIQMRNILAALRRENPQMPPSDLNHLLTSTVRQWQREGRILFPHEYSDAWENGSLPKWLEVPQAPQAAPSLKTLRDRAPWVGQMLEIGPDLPLNKSSITKALAINDYFRRRDHREWVPARERSLQLFGDEKLLDSARVSGLFSGRITLDDIDCFYVPEPLNGVRICKESNGPILIIENSTTFFTIQKFNRYHKRYSAVVYGRGKLMKNAGLATDSLEEVREEVADLHDMRKLPEVHYFGDIDPEGISIPLEINRIREIHDLSLLVPATDLYELLMLFPSQPKAHEWMASLKEEDIIDWLPSIGREICDTMRDGYRWCQEYAGHKQLNLLWKTGADEPAE